MAYRISQFFPEILILTPLFTTDGGIIHVQGYMNCTIISNFMTFFLVVLFAAHPLYFSYSVGYDISSKRILNFPIQ